MTPRTAERRPTATAAKRRAAVRQQAPVLAVISVGGAIGSLTRYGLGLALPTPSGAFPWATFLINAVGCGLIGVLMVLITEVWAAHRLLRPFLGVGILGGFTTFSTCATEARGLLAAGEWPTAIGYLLGTLVAALLATVLGIAATRAAFRHRRVR